MRNLIILSLGVIFFLFLALFGAGTGDKQSFHGGQAQLASPYASGLHLATRIPDNTIQLSGDYLWRFVYAWDGTRWEQRDLGQLLNLTRDNTIGGLSHADNRFIVAGAQRPVSIALSQLGATSPQYLAFWSANLQNNNWCGGCDEAGNKGRWQVIRVADIAEAAPVFTQSQNLPLFADVPDSALLVGDTFVDEGSRITLPADHTTLKWIVRDPAHSSHFVAVGNDGRWTNWLPLTTTTQSDPSAQTQRITLPLNNIPAGTYQIAVASCADNATPGNGNCTVLQQRNTAAPTVVVQGATAKAQAASAAPIPPAGLVIGDPYVTPLARSFFALGKHATGPYAARHNENMVFHVFLNDLDPGRIDHFEVSADGKTWMPFRLGNTARAGETALPECRFRYSESARREEMRPDSPLPCYRWDDNTLQGRELTTIPGFHRNSRHMSVHIPTASLAVPTGFASYSIALRSCNAAGCSAGRAFPSFSILSDQTEPILIIDPIEAFTGEEGSGQTAVPTVTRTANLPTITLPENTTTIATGPCTIFAGYDSCPARITWSAPQSTARLFVKRPSQSEPQLAAQGPGGTQPFTGDQVFEVSAHRTTLPFGILTIVTDEPVFTLAALSGAQLANGEVNVSYSNDPPQPFANCLPLPSPKTDRWQEGYDNGLPFCPEGVTAADDGTVAQASAASAVQKAQEAEQIPENSVTFEACNGSLRCGLLRIYGGNEQDGTFPRGVFPYNQQARLVGDRHFPDQESYEQDLVRTSSELRQATEFLHGVPAIPGFTDTRVVIALDRESWREEMENYLQRTYPRESADARSMYLQHLSSNAVGLASDKHMGRLFSGQPEVYVFNRNMVDVGNTLVHEMAHVLDYTNREIAMFTFEFGYESLFSESEMLFQGDATERVQQAANTVYAISNTYNAAREMRETQTNPDDPFSVALSGLPSGGGSGMGSSPRAKHGRKNEYEFVAVSAEDMYVQMLENNHLPTPLAEIRNHFVSELFGGANGPFFATQDILSPNFSSVVNQELIEFVRNTVRDRILTGNGLTEEDLLSLQRDFQNITTRDDSSSSDIFDLDPEFGGGFEDIDFSAEGEIGSGTRLPRPTAPDAFEHMADFAGGGGLTDDETNYFDVGGGFNVPTGDVTAEPQGWDWGGFEWGGV